MNFIGDKYHDPSVATWRSFSIAEPNRQSFTVKTNEECRTSWTILKKPCDAHGLLVRGVLDFVLPESHDFNATSTQLFCHYSLPLPISFEFHCPVRRAGVWDMAAQLTSMPKTPIHKYRQLGFPEV